jgi:hypothetical protein
MLPAPRRPEVNHRGRITSTDVTRERRTDSGKKANPRKIWRPRQHTAEPAGSPELEPGWTPAKRRRRTTWRSSPPRHDGRQDRRRSAPSSCPTTSLQAFIAATMGRCFNCLARDHRALQCHDPVRCLNCRRSGHRARFCSEPPRTPTRG